MAKSKPKPKPKGDTYDYIFDPRYDYIVCFSSKNSNCLVARLWEAGRSDFHDAELQDATNEINKILDRVARGNDDPSRHACLINVQGQLLLVWSHHDVVTGDDDPAKVAKALKLKRARDEDR